MSTWWRCVLDIGDSLGGWAGHTDIATDKIDRCDYLVSLTIDHHSLGLK